jgi:hypothetical protein
MIESVLLKVLSCWCVRIHQMYFVSQGCVTTVLSLRRLWTWMLLVCLYVLPLNVFPKTEFFSDNLISKEIVDQMLISTGENSQVMCFQISGLGWDRGAVCARMSWCMVGYPQKTAHMCASNMRFWVTYRACQVTGHNSEGGKWRWPKVNHVAACRFLEKPCSATRYISLPQ